MLERHSSSDVTWIFQIQCFEITRPRCLAINNQPQLASRDVPQMSPRQLFKSRKKRPIYEGAPFMTRIQFLAFTWPRFLSRVPGYELRISRLVFSLSQVPRFSQFTRGIWPYAPKKPAFQKLPMIPFLWWARAVSFSVVCSYIQSCKYS